ncbi:YaeQ family protein [Orrella sp. JC864]|uniref:YaeQ family protein n=1 Tax=Orrella sp. JC864 TaxID=3120298 RepID=UPI0012BCD62C
MALSATIYKAQLHVADNDRGYYGSHSLTVARHPSETDERLMVRLLAYALYADGDESLAFARGLSDTDEPDLWRRDLTGAVTQWIETGLPDERRIMKACGRAGEVVVLAYGRSADTWWSGIRGKLARARKLKVFGLPAASTAELAALAERTMTLNVSIDAGTAWVCAGKGEASIPVQPLHV